MTALPQHDYIWSGMRKSLAVKTLSLLAVGVVLAHLSPVVTGMLVCIGDGTDPDCCRNPGSTQFTADQATHVLSGSKCSCCVTVDTTAVTVDATSQKVSTDVLSPVCALGDVVPATGTRVVRPGANNPANPRLPSLRTVVLLI